MTGDGNAGRRRQHEAVRADSTDVPRLSRPSGADLAVLARLMDEHKLKIITDRTFPFAEIGDAFAYLEQGRARGKVAVRMV